MVENMEYNISARGVDKRLKARYEASEAEAVNYCGELLRLRDTGDLSYDVVYKYMERIVRAKYYLDEEVLDSNRFHYLGELSVARALGRNISEIQGIDLEAKCNGTSTVMTKKILLFMFINRQLGVSISAEQAADALSLDDLALLVFQQLS